MNPTHRRYGAIVLLVASLIGWPLSIFTFAKDEPPAILGLSWFAITLTALDILLTADVREQEEESSS